MENSSKPRKIATVLVDNYVDDVDRLEYMHENAENIYTTVSMYILPHVCMEKPGILQIAARESQDKYCRAAREFIVGRNIS